MFRYENLNNLIPPAGEYFWKFSTDPTAQPTDIDVKSANGVTGIQAELPSETGLRLLLINSNAEFIRPFAGVCYVDGAGILVNGTDKTKAYLQFIDAAGVVSRLIRVDATSGNFEAENTGTAEVYSLQFDETQRLEALSDGAGNQVQDTMSIAQFNREAENAAGDDNKEAMTAASRQYQITDAGAIASYNKAVFVNISTEAIDDGAGASLTIQKVSSQLGISIEVAAAVVAEMYMSNNGFFIYGAAGATRFGIEAATGRIRTDQTAAAGVHAVLAAELPIYNAAGVLVGYIPIFT